MSTDFISPFNKLPLLMQEVILIVGEKGIGKHALAKAMVELSTSKKLQCRTATSLPLPEDNSSDRPMIDMIVFMIDSSNRYSYTQIEKSLQFVDRKYFLGKACFVAARVPTQMQCVEIESVTQLGDDHDSPVFWMDPSNDSDRTCVAKQLLQMLQISSGLREGVSPLLIDSTRRQYESQIL